MKTLIDFDTEARTKGTYITLSPFLEKCSEFEEALLLYIAEHHGVSTSVQLILAWEQEMAKWNQGEGVFQ